MVYHVVNRPLISRSIQLHSTNKLYRRPCKLTFNLLTLKVVSESRVTWATSVPILVFSALSALDLDPMYATDRQTDVRQKHRLMPPPIRGGA